MSRLSAQKRQEAQRRARAAREGAPRPYELSDAEWQSQAMAPINAIGSGIQALFQGGPNGRQVARNGELRNAPAAAAAAGAVETFNDMRREADKRYAESNFRDMRDKAQALYDKNIPQVTPPERARDSALTAMAQQYAPEQVASWRTAEGQKLAAAADARAKARAEGGGYGPGSEQYYQDADMAAWAAANPTLAKKLRERNGLPAEIPAPGKSKGKAGGSESSGFTATIGGEQYPVSPEAVQDWKDQNPGASEEQMMEAMGAQRGSTMAQRMAPFDLAPSWKTNAYEAPKNQAEEVEFMQASVGDPEAGASPTVVTQNAFQFPDPNEDRAISVADPNAMLPIAERPITAFQNREAAFGGQATLPQMRNDESDAANPGVEVSQPFADGNMPNPADSFLQERLNRVKLIY